MMSTSLSAAGSGGVVVAFKSRIPNVGSSNLTQTTDPERSAIGIPLGLSNHFRLTQRNGGETVIAG